MPAAAPDPFGVAADLLDPPPAVWPNSGWRAQARPDQQPPEGEWHTLLLRGGRGSGKSWAGARILCDLIFNDPVRANEGPGAWAIVAPTFGDARDKCVESDESGILDALGTSVGEIETGRSLTVAKWNRSIGEMELVDGTMIYIDGADDGAYRIQGHNLRGVWADEIGLWRKWKAAWDESIAFALRKGQSRRVATGTPKRNQGARVLVARLLKDESVVSRRLSTRDNLANLSGAFVQEIRRYEGTDLGRQELEGELLEDIEGAMWRREWIDTARVERAPEMRHVVVGVDPASGGHEKALVVAGVGIDGELYVLASEADRSSSSEVWLSRVIDVALAWSATLVVERNHGAAFLTGLLDAVMAARGVHVPYRPVWASVGKTVRAEGPALLTEQGRVHFVGYHPQLEDEMCSMVVGQPGEDDLADACLVAGTLVDTARGQVPIESVQRGDWARTRAGWRRVARAERTGVDRPVRTLVVGGGRRLTGTADHPVWVEGCGWTRLDAVVCGDKVCVYTAQQRSSSFKGKRSCVPSAAKQRSGTMSRATRCASALRVAAVGRQIVNIAMSTRFRARSVTRRSGRADTGSSPRLAAVSVLGSCDAGAAAVYNLEVQGQPEYFANGILVHNCVWAITELMRHGAGGGDVPVLKWGDSQSAAVAQWA